MNKEPTRLIWRVAQWVALIALIVYLVRLSVSYLSEVWWVLAIIAAVIIAIVIFVRMGQNSPKW